MELDVLMASVMADRVNAEAESATATLSDTAISGDEVAGAGVSVTAMVSSAVIIRLEGSTTLGVSVIPTVSDTLILVPMAAIG
jgi:hypothetical protein